MGDRLFVIRGKKNGEKQAYFRQNRTIAHCQQTVATLCGSLIDWRRLVSAVKQGKEKREIHRGLRVFTLNIMLAVPQGGLAVEIANLGTWQAWLFRFR